MQTNNRVLTATAGILTVALLYLAVSVLYQNTLPGSGINIARNPQQMSRIDRASISEAYGKLPLRFEVNRGQQDRSVKFVSRGRGYDLFLTDRESVLILSDPSGVTQQQHEPREQSVLRMKFVGAESSAKASGEQELAGRVNYFVGNEPAQWQQDVPTYSRVRYSGVYAGIDLVYYGNQQQLEYDMILQPYADPQAIRLSIDGGKDISVDSEGSLVVETATSAVHWKRPVVYQDVEGERRFVNGQYVMHSANEIGFQVAEYDRTKPLVIDPVLVYSSYLGGSSEDLGFGITTDAAGNAYITGQTASANFPTASAYQSANLAPYNAFITKLNATGTDIVYSTYLGGSGGGPYNDQGKSIAVDAAGNVYVAGTTNSTNFPVTPGAFQTTFAGGGFTGCCFPGDVFVTKLSPTGSALIYSTYLGGSGWDVGSDIAVDATGHVFLVGQTHSTNFPVTAGAFRTSYPGSYGCGGNTNSGFVTKVSPDGTGLVYSTYLGGGGFDQAIGVAIDSGGNAYVVGSTQSHDFPTTTDAFQSSVPGSSCPGQAYVTKLNASGSALHYSTYLGGPNGYGQAADIAVDGSGSAFVTGYTISTAFPTTPGAFQSTAGGGTDGFLTQLDPTGSALVYSTYLGGGGSDQGIGVALDASGKVYMIGSTGSNDFPTTADALQSINGGGDDAFLTKFDTAGPGLVYSTYLGGGGGDVGWGIAHDGAQNVYLSGWTSSTNFVTTSGAFQMNSAGSNDAFVIKLSFFIPEPTPTPTPTPEPTPTPYSFTGFFQPVDNLPALNIAASGSSIPVKFSLAGYQGHGVFAPGYPVSAPIACDANEPGSIIEETVTAGGSSLSYNAATDEYSYIWKTNKTWKGSCRMLVVRFIDGTDHYAKFRFK